MKTQIIILIFVMITGLSFAQTGSITNINAAQRTDGSMIVDIYYDVAGIQSKFWITAEASFNAGTNFFTISQLSGDHGDNITTGISKHIIWDFGSEFPGYYSPTTQIRLTASFICGTVLFDPRDSQTYNTVQIGDRCWMAENLNIDIVGSIDKVCYANLESFCDIYGGLYDWYTVMNTFPDFICPYGWSVPTTDEWCDMTSFLDEYTDCMFGWEGFDIGQQLKSPYMQGLNTSGFTALGGGYQAGLVFVGIGYCAYFWTSSVQLNGYVDYFSLESPYDQIFYYVQLPSYHMSVRCIKN